MMPEKEYKVRVFNDWKKIQDGPADAPASIPVCLTDSPLLECEGHHHVNAVHLYVEIRNTGSQRSETRAEFS